MRPDLIFQFASHLSVKFNETEWPIMNVRNYFITIGSGNDLVQCQGQNIIDLVLALPVV